MKVLEVIHFLLVVSTLLLTCLIEKLIGVREVTVGKSKDMCVPDVGGHTCVCCKSGQTYSQAGLPLAMTLYLLTSHYVDIICYCYI